MKIAVIGKILNKKSGSRAAIELAKSLAVKNRVVFICSKEKFDPEVEKALEESDIKIYAVDNWFKIYPVINKENPDIISSHAPLLPTLIAKLTGKPAALTYYGTQLDAYLEHLLPTQNPSLKDKLLNRLGNWTTLLLMKARLALANQIIAISRYTASEARKLYGKKIPFVYLGADSTSLKTPRRCAPRPAPHVVLGYALLQGKEKKSTSLNLLSVSRFTPYKGFHVLIEAVKSFKKEFPNLKLTLVGSTSNHKYLKYLQKLTKDKNINILTNISDQELARKYQQADIYLSWDWWLFFGLPILEAASFATPTIALNRCAAPETVIHSKTGYLVSDKKELLKYLKKLIKNPGLAKKMGQAARKQAKKFTWHKTAQGYREILKSILYE